MGKDEVASRLKMAEAQLVQEKMNRNRRRQQVIDSEHNIAMLAVTVTELKAAQAIQYMELD